MMTLTDKVNANKDRVVVVGPVITDQYYLGKATRLDQTSAIPIIDVDRKHIFSGIGGGGNAARCLAHLSMPVAFVSVVGTDPSGKAFLQTGDELITRYVATSSHYQTPMKHRIYASGKLAARFDVDETPKANVEDYVVDMFQKCVDDVKPLAILISDYDKGICTERTLTVIMKYAKENDVKVIVDPVPGHMQWYRGAYLITPNEQEVLAATDLDDVERAAKVVCQELDIDTCMVTRGAQGLLMVQADTDAVHVPAVPALAVDTCGAGDVIAAVAAYGIAALMTYETIQQMAVTAGAISVETGGAGVVPLHQIHRRITTVYGNTRKAVQEGYASLLRISVALSKASFGITNGIFDVLHPGHVSMLEQARSKCDFLLVLVNTDESATLVKRKPLQDYATRASQLSALSCVDAIMAFDGETPMGVIGRLLPDILVKGPELAGKEDSIPGAKEVKEAGGKVITTTLEHDIHTSDIIQQAQEVVSVARKEVAT